MLIETDGTEILEKLTTAKQRIVINEGSSRSGKTYAIIQHLVNIALANKNKNLVFSIVRKTLPSLKASAYRDFLEILEKYGIYNENFHNKSDLAYMLSGNLFEFFSMDQYDKVKGRKRDYLFMNEANEDGISFNHFTQLSMRTSLQIFIDYNPSHDEFHWIEDKVKKRKNVVVFHSTYIDNPFLSDETIFEIESLKDTDPNLWRIYGLGLMGIASVRIYTHFQYVDTLPIEYNEMFYSLDFGYNHPTSLNQIIEVDDKYYVHELIYSSGLTNSDLIRKMEELKIDKNKFIFCDSAEPQRIEELRRAGFNAYGSNKDVKKGIDTVKSKKIYITKDSINLQKEARGYSWKTTADGKILDEPVKLNDDGMDSMRYGVHTYLEMKNKQPNIRVI